MSQNAGMNRFIGLMKGPAALLLMLSFLIAFIIPLPAFIIDFALVLALAISITIYLRSLTIGEWSELKNFPTILLLFTIFRIALNITTTRKILEDGEAGSVIEMFGEVVIGSNLVIGMVIFTIMIIVQFIIANGSARTSEVAARFTLDSLPINSMSIDSELNQGLITQDEAKKKKHDLDMRKEFFGNMDGAGKFIKGDVWIGVILVFVNSIAGLLIGVLYKGLTLSEAAYKYTLLTVGDGIVNQLTSLIVAISSGLVITRVYDGKKENVGKGIFQELTFNPIVMYVVATVTFGLGVLTGVYLPFVILALVFAGLGYVRSKSVKKELILEDELTRERLKLEAESKQDNPEEFEVVGEVEPISLEIGLALIPLVTTEKDGQTIVDKITLMRRSIGEELGVNIPSIRIMDNVSLNPFNKYQIKIKGSLVAESELMLSHVLALKTPFVTEDIDGQPTKDPVYGEEAVWILEDEAERAKQAGYIVKDALNIITLHLEEMIKSHLHELLRRQEVKNLLDKVQKRNPVLLGEIEKKNISLSKIQGVLQNLLREKISIKDLAHIIEGIIDAADHFEEVDNMTTLVRERVRAQICENLKNDDGRIYLILLSTDLENIAVRHRHDGYCLDLNIQEEKLLIEEINKKYERASMAGIEPALFTHNAPLRIALSRALQKFDVDLPVVARNELMAGILLEQVGIVEVPGISKDN